MHSQIIGISGSPIKNSNTDRLIQAVLESSGLSSEFVKPLEVHWIWKKTEKYQGPMSDMQIRVKLPFYP